MSWSRQYTVWCNEPECVEFLEVDADTLAWARLLVRESRWYSGTKGDYCQVHAAEKGITPKRRPKPGLLLHEVPTSDA